MLAIHEWQPPSADAAQDAPISVLVHGVTGWHRTWWRVGPALAAQGWRVVAVDLPGHGHSPPIDGTVTMQQLAAEVLEVIDALDGVVDLLVGHSLGGAVSIELAAARPDRVRRLVVEDPPAINRAEDVAWLYNLEREIGAARTDFESEVRRTREQNPDWLAEDARQDVEGKALADGSGIVASYRADIGNRVLSLLPRLHVPTLLLLADEDRSVFPPNARRQLAGRLPDTIETVVLDAGHCIHRDRFDEYVAAVVDWSGGPAAP